MSDEAVCRTAPATPGLLTSGRSCRYPCGVKWNTLTCTRLHSFSPVMQVLSPSNLAYSRGRVTPQALVTLVERHWDSQPQEVPVNLLMTPVSMLIVKFTSFAGACLLHCTLGKGPGGGEEEAGEGAGGGCQEGGVAGPGDL